MIESNENNMCEHMHTLKWSEMLDSTQHYDWFMCIYVCNNAL